jgi:WD40 repeat protein
MQSPQTDYQLSHRTRAAAALVFLLLAAAVWWLTPLRPRTVLPRGSVVLGFSPDGSLLATRQEGEVTFWDVATGRAAGGLSGAPADFREVAFSPDGHWLAAGGEGVLKLWEVPTGHERAALPVSADKQFYPGATFSPDGQWLAFRAKGPDPAQQVKVWDLTQGRERAALPGRAGPLLFSPDGKLLAFESLEPSPDGPPVGRIRLWDTGAGQEISLSGDHPGPLRVLAFSHDGRTLATGERVGWQSPGPHEVKLWDLGSGKAEGTWRLPRGVGELRFSDDGSRLLVWRYRDDPDVLWRWDIVVIHLAVRQLGDDSSSWEPESVTFANTLSPAGVCLVDMQLCVLERIGD